MNHIIKEMLSIILDYANESNWSNSDKLKQSETQIWIGPGAGPDLAKNFIKYFLKDQEIKTHKKASEELIYEQLELFPNPLTNNFFN